MSKQKKRQIDYCNQQIKKFERDKKKIVADGNEWLVDLIEVDILAYKLAKEELESK